MATRKRIRSAVKTVTGSGGGSTPGGGIVQWGPDFGGVDGDRLDASATAALTEIELTGALAAADTLALTQVDLTGALSETSTLALPEVALTGALSASCALDLGELELAGALAATGTLAMTQVDLTGALSGTGAPALTQVDLTGALNGTCDVSTLTYETSQILAHKDAWVPTERTLGNCDDAGNHDGEDLRVGNVGLVENLPKSYFAWDLTDFPSGATVTLAQLSLKPTAAPVLAHDYHIRGIDAGGEGWAENTITCNNAPAVTAPDHTYTQPDTATDLTIDITAAFASYIAGRMGSANTCTMVLEDREAVGIVQTYESKDEGTNDAQGPRLLLRFTVPV